MHIKIGIIGSEQYVQKLLTTITAFPTFSPVVGYANNDKELIDQATQIKDDIEVLLLFGAHAHRQVKEAVALTSPVHYVPLTGTGLYRILFYALQMGKLFGGITVDSITKSMVTSSLHELDIDQTQIWMYQGAAHDSPEALLQFHLDKAAMNESTLAITGNEKVAHLLREAGHDSQLLLPSTQDMTVALERALLSTETRRSKELQIVVGMINVDDFGKIALKRHSEHEVQVLKLDIHRMVLDYVESLDGYLTSLGGDEYLFVTTRGIFERETGGYKFVPLAKEAHHSYGLSLSIGVGFGLTANDAGTNARAALRTAKEAGGNACFIVREDATLIGPLEMAESVQIVLPPTDQVLIKRAEEAGMTSVYLSKLLTHRAKYGKYEYKVHELAQLLEITVRSTHRLLQNWMDHGLVDISGVEKVPRGRPRQIFRFSFLVD